MFHRHEQTMCSFRVKIERALAFGGISRANRDLSAKALSASNVVQRFRKAE